MCHNCEIEDSLHATLEPFEWIYSIWPRIPIPKRRFVHSETIGFWVSLAHQDTGLEGSVLSIGLRGLQCYGALSSVQFQKSTTHTLE